MEEFRVPLDFRGHEGEAIYTVGRYDDYIEFHLPPDERAQEKLRRCFRSLPRRSEHGEYELKLYPDQPELVSLLLLREVERANGRHGAVERLDEILGDLRTVAPQLCFGRPERLGRRRLYQAAS